MQEEYDKEKAREAECRRKLVDKRTQTKTELTAEKYNEMGSKIALRYGSSSCTVV